MRISDIIEDFIKEMLEDDDSAIIQRNDLAEHFNCVPSQINYVISTRFTPIQGYYVGYIKIHRVNVTHSDYLMHIINNVGNSITSREIDIFLKNMVDNDIIDAKEEKLIRSATNDKAISIANNKKDELRANIFKSMLITLV